MLFFLTSLCFVCLALIVYGFTGSNRSLRFATLLGASVTGFIVPEVFGEYNAGVVPLETLKMYIGMTVLCMVCAALGDWWGYVRPGGRLRTMAQYDERRVLEAALILNLFALIASMLIQVAYGEEIARQALNPGRMSGPMTIAIFFATVQRYGFALALLLFWRRPSVLSVLMIIFGLLNYGTAVIVGARRGSAMEFAFISLLTFAVARRKAIPAIVVVLLFVGGTLWSTAITNFRIRDDRTFFEKVETASYIGDFLNVVHRGGLEVRNGCDAIQYAYDNDSYDYGKVYWNQLVHSFFPAQIFGREAKEELKFDIDNLVEKLNVRHGTVGVAETGMAESFDSFGYLGCVNYLLMGFVMGRWYRRAFQGDLAAQLAYSTLITAALHTISHGTTWLLKEYIHMAIFSYPVLYFARKPARLAAGRAPRPRPQSSGAEPPWGVAPAMR
jgi:hypothetical protein